jgi:PTH1 family peptidyl-tRNA hydrolase
MAIKLIVGLGNPGTEYSKTRHNVGFWLLDSLAKECSVSFKLEKKFKCELAQAEYRGHKLWLMKPTTYMNLSGESVQLVAHFYKIKINEILAVHDELDLPPGTARIKRDGGHAGNNGLKSIISCMGGKQFYRLRIGIGKPARQGVEHVLGKPKADEKIKIDDAITSALNTLPALVNGEIEQAMHQLHTNNT